jgi:hypothetical protein
MPSTKGPDHPYGMDYEGYELFDKAQKEKGRAKKEYSDDEEFQFEEKPKAKVVKSEAVAIAKAVEVVEVKDSSEDEGCDKKPSAKDIEVIEVKDSTEEEVGGVTEEVAAATTEEAIADVVIKCRFCERNPCLVDVVYAEMMYIAEGMEDDVDDNKEIRYALYRFVSRKLFGRLGPGNRKGIPHCIMMEIHDAYPNSRGTKYVGFKQSGNDGDKDADTSDSD